MEVQKLTMKPGDILALRVDRILSNEQINNMREELEQIRPDGVKIAILDATCQLQIVEPPNATELTGAASPRPAEGEARSEVE